MSDLMLLTYLYKAEASLRAGRIGYPQFVDRIEQIVVTLRREESASADAVFRVWGQMEIINAVSLSCGEELNEQDLIDIDLLIDELRTILEVTAGPERT